MQDFRDNLMEIDDVVGDFQLDSKEIDDLIEKSKEQDINSSIEYKDLMTWVCKLDYNINDKKELLEALNHYLERKLREWLKDLHNYELLGIEKVYCPECDEKHLVAKVEYDTKCVFREQEVNYKEIMYYCIDKDELFETPEMCNDNLMRAKVQYTYQNELNNK